MTKKHITLAGLSAFIILLAAVYIAGGVRNRNRIIGGGPEEQAALPGMDYRTVVSLEAPLTGIRLEKKGELWELVPPRAERLDQAEIGYQLMSLAGMRAERLVEEDPADLSIYGLDKPSGRIIMADAGGKRLELMGGNMTPSKTGYYVMAAGEAKVYAVPLYAAARLFLDLNGIRDKTLFGPFEPADFKRLALESADFSFEIRPRAGEDSGEIPFNPFGSYIIRGAYRNPHAADAEKVAGIIESFRGLGIRRFVDPDPVSPEPYGLDRPLRVGFEAGEQTLDLLLGGEEDGETYARRPGSPEVFTLAGLEALRGIRAFELTDKFALLVNIENVEALRVSGEGKTLSAEIRGAGDEAVYLFNGKQAEERSFKNWYQRVIGLLTDAELPARPAAAAPQQQPRGEEISIEYTLKASPFRAGIGLIPYNRDFYALDQGGAVEFLVSRSQVREIFDAAEVMVYAGS
ncbi:MAG: DUF4340 domain-containing protein [Treponema sp.]|jgi:hypothetical protein|nr:DUF4340 domain-containing protein [Treponema sp.]